MEQKRCKIITCYDVKNVYIIYDIIMSKDKTPEAIMLHVLGYEIASKQFCPLAELPDLVV